MGYFKTLMIFILLSSSVFSQSSSMSDSIKKIDGKWIVNKLIVGKIADITYKKAKSVINDSIIISYPYIQVFRQKGKINGTDILKEEIGKYFDENMSEPLPDELDRFEGQNITEYTINAYDLKKETFTIVFILIDNKSAIYFYKGHYCLLERK